MCGNIRGTFRNRAWAAMSPMAGPLKFTSAKTRSSSSIRRATSSTSAGSALLRLRSAHTKRRPCTPPAALASSKASLKPRFSPSSESEPTADSTPMSMVVSVTPLPSPWRPRATPAIAITATRSTAERMTFIAEHHRMAGTASGLIEERASGGSHLFERTPGRARGEQPDVEHDDEHGDADRAECRDRAGL